MTTTPSGAFFNEPFVDFGLRTSRERMLLALRRVRSELGRNHPAWIGGDDLPSGDWIPSENPANAREIVGCFPRTCEADADRAVEAAARAFSSWRRTDVSVRTAFLRRIAAALRSRRFELAAWEVLECAKQWREADADVAEAIDFCEYYAARMDELGRPRLRREPGEDDLYEYRPRGVTAVIAPWNFPLAILCGMTVAPLAAGNTVVVKPAEQSSIVAAKFAEILRTLDPPEGVVNFLPGVGEVVGRRLVEHPDVAVVNFTGSLAVGLWIHRAASAVAPGQRRIKHVLAELGGKNAVLVDDDADLDEAVLGVVQSAFGYQGQKCSACSRVVLTPRIYDPFVERLRQATASLAVGPPEDPAFQLGPVIDRDAQLRLERVAESATGDAELLYAGDVRGLADVGYYVPPRVFAVADPSSRLAQEEFFGPILTVLRAADLDDALAIANGTPYALTGGLYSRDPRTIERVKEEFEVGNLYINRKITGAEVDRQPFGGYKMSGTGSKAGGPDYLRHFLWPRTVVENTLRRGFAPDAESDAGPPGEFPNPPTRN